MSLAGRNFIQRIDNINRIDTLVVLVLVLDAGLPVRGFAPYELIIHS